ncbi:unnamed protein product, partial [marine sediment metagenome]
ISLKNPDYPFLVIMLVKSYIASHFAPAFAMVTGATR